MDSRVEALVPQVMSDCRSKSYSNIESTTQLLHIPFFVCSMRSSVQHLFWSHQADEDGDSSSLSPCHTLGRDANVMDIFLFACHCGFAGPCHSHSNIGSDLAVDFAGLSTQVALTVSPQVVKVLADAAQQPSTSGIAASLDAAFSHAC